MHGHRGKQEAAQRTGDCPVKELCGMAKPTLRSGERNVVCGMGQDGAGREGTVDVQEDAAGAVLPPQV